MNYTLDVALGKIQSGETVTLEDYDKLVRDTSAIARNAIDKPTSILYAGDLPGAKSGEADAWRFAQALRDSSVVDGSDVRRAVVLGSDTDVGQLLQKQVFIDGYRSAIEQHLSQTVSGWDGMTGIEQERLIDIEFLRRVDGEDASGARIKITPEFTPFWDIASANFVKQANGNFAIFAWTPDQLAVLMQTEIRALIEKGGDFKVNGRSLGDLLQVKEQLIAEGRTAEFAEQAIRDRLLFEGLVH